MLEGGLDLECRRPADQGRGQACSEAPSITFCWKIEFLNVVCFGGTTMETARIIIVGGGFAGANLAEHLKKQLASGTEVVVISNENHMVFTPMLAEVAGRSLSGLDVVVPGRQIAPQATCLMATVTSVDLNKDEV